MISDIILELMDELVDPSEAILDDQIEETLEDEEDIILGIGDNEDRVIEFIAGGNRLTNSDPVDFTDDDVEETVEDDDNESGLDDDNFTIDDIEESYTYDI